MIPDLTDGLTSGSDEERAVSPVVGVALLIAITVILAAVIGFVVLETQSDTTDTQNARVDFANTSSGVQVTHEGGDTFNASRVSYKVNGANEQAINITGTWDTGDQFTVGSVSSGDQITIIWDDPESDRQVQVASYTVE